MGVLDSNPLGELPIKHVTPKSMSDLGFRVMATGSTAAKYERIKFGYKIVLSLVSYSSAGTMNVAKVIRTHGKTKYETMHNYRVDTIDQFINYLNTYSK